MLKKIIDGAFWNYSFYGKYPNGKYIFMNSEKIIVYPPIDSIVSYEERINNNFFYKGLLEIKSSIKIEFGNCSICKHLWDTYYIGEDKFSVCKKDILINR
ncbi:hypothetical protein [Sediminibacterium sp.]|uniref:hypothetical protein n=1 Tax=Sediminibacterium sp. TaxID=1917865 RepID=UPI003F6FEF0D